MLKAKFELEDLSKDVQIAIKNINYACNKYNIKTKEDVENIFKFVEAIKELDKYFIIDWNYKKEKDK